MSAAAAGDDGDERRTDRAPANNATNSRKRRKENGDAGKANAKKWKCRFCNQEFETCTGLGGHMNSHREDRKKEELQKAQELVSKAENKKRNAMFYENMFARYAGGPAATVIPQSPYGQASGMTSPLQALGARPSLNFPPGSCYYQPMGPMHQQQPMLQHSSNSMQRWNPGIPSMQQSSNSLQQENLDYQLQIASDLDWTRNTNFNSNVQGAPTDLRNGFGNSAGNHKHQNPHWNQDDNMDRNALTDVISEPVADSYDIEDADSYDIEDILNLYAQPQHPMGSMHPDMLVSSNSLMQQSSNNLQQGNPGIASTQQNASDLDWTSNTNSNVQGAPSNLRKDLGNSSGDHLH